MEIKKNIKTETVIKTIDTLSYMTDDAYKMNWISFKIRENARKIKIESRMIFSLLSGDILLKDKLVCEAKLRRNFRRILRLLYTNMDSYKIKGLGNAGSLLQILIELI